MSLDNVTVGIFSIAAGHRSGHRQMHRHGVDQVAATPAVSQPEIRMSGIGFVNYLESGAAEQAILVSFLGFLMHFWTSFDIS